MSESLRFSKISKLQGRQFGAVVAIATMLGFAALGERINSLSNARPAHLPHGLAPSALRIFRRWRAFFLAIVLLSCLGRGSVALAQVPPGQVSGLKADLYWRWRLTPALPRPSMRGRPAVARSRRLTLRHFPK